MSERITTKPTIGDEDVLNTSQFDKLAQVASMGQDEQSTGQIATVDIPWDDLSVAHESDNTPPPVQIDMSSRRIMGTYILGSTPPVNTDAPFFIA